MTKKQFYFHIPPDATAPARIWGETRPLLEQLQWAVERAGGQAKLRTCKRGGLVAEVTFVKERELDFALAAGDALWPNRSAYDLD